MSSNHHRLTRSRRPLSEQAAIALLDRVLATGRRVPQVEVGIGDDAAVLRLGPGRVVWTVDACTEGVHFDRSWLSLRDLGWRSLMAAASDLAAMGATPVAALSQLGLPESVTRSELGGLARGQAAAARAIACPVIGGNISRASELGVVTTVLGQVKRPLLRSGARAGDGLFVSGALGRAALGLRLLQQGQPARSASERSALGAWRRPRALIERGSELVGRAHAAVDVSDGLAGDADHIASASRVRVVIEAQALLEREPKGFALAAERVGESALELMLFGGEDYALLVASSRAPRGFDRVGRVEAGRGLWLERANGSRQRVTRGGFDHFAR